MTSIKKKTEPCNFIQDLTVAVYPYVFHYVCITSATFAECHNTQKTVSSSLPIFPIFHRGPAENTTNILRNFALPPVSDPVYRRCIRLHSYRQVLR